MNEDRNALLAFLVIVAAAAALYANSLPNAFTFDDHAIVESNRLLPDGAWSEVLTSPFWPGQPELGLYRPVTVASLALNARLFGPDPLSFRVTNILLHAAVACLVFSLVTALCGRGPALAAALVFVTHPVHTEAVNAVVGRAELLAALFFLLAWIAYRRAHRERFWLLPCAIAYGLASLSKEHAIVLPAVLIAEDALIYHEGSVSDRAAALAERWRRYVPLAVVGVGVLALRTSLIGSLTLPQPPAFVDNPLAYAATVDRVPAGFAILARYVRLLILPVTLSVDYTYAQVPAAVSVFDPRALLGLGVFASLLTICYRALTEEMNEMVALGCAVFLAAWFPISNVPFPVGTPMNERLLYLPSIGFAILAAVGYGRLRESAGRCPPWALVLALCLLFGGRTVARNADWRNDLTLFRAATEASPRSAKAYFNLGNALRDRGNDAGALDAYGLALDIHPAYAEVYYNQGIVYQRRGDRASALQAYEKAIELAPAHVNALVNRGILLVRMGRKDEGVDALRRAVSAAPARADVRFNLARALEASAPVEAIDVYRDVLERRPGHEDAAVNLARLLKQAGRTQEAIEVYRSVARMNPDALGVVYNLAVELERAGETGPALARYRRVWQAGTEAGAFGRFRMGLLFAREGRDDSARVALREFKEAWEGDPARIRAADAVLERLR